MKSLEPIAKDTRMSTALEKLAEIEGLDSCGRYGRLAREAAAALRTLPSSDQCVAREALESIIKLDQRERKIAINFDFAGNDYAIEMVDGPCAAIARAALAAPHPQAAVAETNAVREALTLGRDAVMESFDHVSDKADQDIADMRLRSIDAALAAVTGETILEESERLDGTIMQTVRLADGTEIERPLNPERNALRRLIDRALTNPAPTELKP